MSAASWFHPAVAAWFDQTFPAPTAAQAEAWPAIQAGRHVLIAAPTGSGKTLAAFLAAIDSLVRQGLDGGLANETQVVYVSPLKALSNDIHRNLEAPLAGIREALRAQGLPEIEIRTWVRTGDTPPGERERMRRSPPQILVTTPESLYILLGSESGRAMLKTARTVIVDEIHALAPNKRGSHLAISLERLSALCGDRLLRIGLSATQKPIEAVARFLVGAGPSARSPDRAKRNPGPPMPNRSAAPHSALLHAGHRLPPDCTIIDTGHRRARDLALEVPSAPLEAVMSGEVWEQVYDRLAQLVEQHRTTLVFVNTRRMAERLSRQLSERLGEDRVTAHHGSMAKERRFDAEQRLARGALRALVATASLELGIDVGDVDLVCQLGSPRSIASFLQRVGRSGHAVSGTPKGRLFPLSRDDLVECAALIDSVNRGELDRLIIPEEPLDVLAQQIVAEVCAQEWNEDELFSLVQRAWPYRALQREDFDAVVTMLTEGFTTRRGRRGALIHHDAVNRMLRGRRGARLTALTSGGTIPDTADYQVLLEPESQVIGTVNEDFAVESMAGDIFQLGNTSYRIRRVERGVVRVEDAHGLSPTIPFWLGEAPGRTDELSSAVSRLRAEIDARLEDSCHAGRGETRSGAPQTRDPGPPTSVFLDPGSHSPADAGSFDRADRVENSDPGAPEQQTVIDWLTNDLGIGEPAALQLTEYLGAARAALGTLPTQDTIVFERFFDEAGGMQLVIHSPYGSRINRAWGLALRKRFCRKFNFELQAAATEDNIVLSLTTAHSFELGEVARYLHSASVRPVLIQAMLDAPTFITRWRWVAAVSLALPRFRGGKKVPPQLARMNAEDLIGTVFPDQIACAENLAGEREVPDHPLVRQTISDCLHEAMDIEGLERLLGRVEAGKIRVVTRDLTEPSPLAHEVLNARPYAFLDDAPLEERRTQAVMSRRWLNPESAADLGQLDADAIARVRSEAWPDPQNDDELHDALVWLGFLTEAEAAAVPAWADWLGTLARDKRVARLTTTNASLWITAERLPQFATLWPQAPLAPAISAPAGAQQSWVPEAALVEILRGRLEGLGPVTQQALAASLGMTPAGIEAGLAALQAEGFAMRGRFTPGTTVEEWCERGLLARINRYTVKRLRAEIEPVAARDFLRFLFEWQRVIPETRMQGPEAVYQVVRQLEGFEAPAGAWETEILPARINRYEPSSLDDHCLAGRVTWARLTPRSGATNGDRKVAPVRSTPITLLERRYTQLWSLPSRTGAPAPLTDAASRVADFLGAHGASFFDEIVDGTRLLRSQVEDALAELVALGLVSSDSFRGLRALLVPAERRKRAAHHYSRRSVTPFGMDGAGRWALARRGQHSPVEFSQKGAGGGAEATEHMARTLLRRYGVVFWRLLEREADWLPPWRDLLYVYRRLEARGEIRGGRFVAGFAGEQFALPEAIGTLREVRRKGDAGALVSLSGADPLNLAGILTPGPKLAALTRNRVLYRDGIPVALLEGGEVRFLETMDGGSEWDARNALLRSAVPAPLVHLS